MFASIVFGFIAGVFISVLIALLLPKGGHFPEEQLVGVDDDSIERCRKICIRLNEILETSPRAMTGLIDVSFEFQTNHNISLDDAGELSDEFTYRVSPLGLLNSALIAAGINAVAVIEDEASGDLVCGFVPHEAE